MEYDVHSDHAAFTSQIDRDGWAVTSPMVDPAMLDRVTAAVEPLFATAATRGGLRNVLETSPEVRDLAQSTTVRSLAQAVLGSTCFVARGILFDKTPDANWRVAWHQDLAIAVRERHEVAGFGSWSEKAGVPHVLPPAHVLENMLAVRVHLDDCTTDNGPVRVLSGSHRRGRLSDAAVEDWKASTEPTECTVARGGILAFRPLLLHASSPARLPLRRRVVHFEFASGELPDGLTWHDRW
jgi:ectoine hydroxylase-related dioxygenase (phytanoyl-CoA dioxygenase family)